MKKIAAIASVLVLLASVGQASVIEVGDTVKLTSIGPTGYITIGGTTYYAGELNITNLSDANSVYSTFCIEVGEHMYFNEYMEIDSMSLDAVEGSLGAVGGSDMLSEESAYLFSNYKTGSYLAGWTDANQLARDYQYAIWFFEGEIEKSYIDAKPYASSLVQLAEANADGYYNVMVANPVSLSTGAIRQSFLVVVPEPGTLALLGFACVGLGGFAARRRKSA